MRERVSMNKVERERERENQEWKRIEVKKRFHEEKKLGMRGKEKKRWDKNRERKEKAEG